MIDFRVKSDVLLSGKTLSFVLESEVRERKILAERFGWLEVSSLGARVKVKMSGDGEFEVWGDLECSLSQACRVTGALVTEHLAIKIKERFGVLGGADGDVDIDALGVSVEPIEGGEIAVGEMICQLIGLEASAWPRAKDSDAEDYVFGGEDSSLKPFASLAELRKKL